MTANLTLSVPSALREARPRDYAEDAVTIGWPRNASGGPLVIVGRLDRGVVFRDGRHTALAEVFVRFLVADGWLAHWLDFARDRMLPPMRPLLERPFWLDPGDPHRYRSAVQALTQPHNYLWWGVPHDHLRLFLAAEPPILGTAVHRVAAEGWSPERAADEAIARVRQLVGN